MTLEPGWSQGILITFPDEMPLQAIDAFEEYYPDRPQDSEYQRQRYPVYNSAHALLGLAWVYTMERDRVVALQGQWLPGGQWTETNIY
jgi:hypothetical protein